MESANAARYRALKQATAHPSRLAVLALLGTGAKSPNGMANALGIPLSRLSHHVRALAVAGLIEETHVEQRRGALEHFYVRTWDGDEIFAPLATLMDLPKLPPKRDKLVTERVREWAAKFGGAEA